MKINFSLLLFLSVNISMAQQLNFDIQATYKKPINKSTLEHAKSMTEINPGYPSDWISDYVSSKVQVIAEGELKTVFGTDDKLTIEQQELLKRADLGTDILFDIKYKALNSTTQSTEHRSINFAVSFLPDFQAEYPGGMPALKKYIYENAICKLKIHDINKFQSTIKFTIDETGAISDAKVVQSSLDFINDNVLRDVILHMIKWTPAHNAQGKNIKQVFELRVGNAGC